MWHDCKSDALIERVMEMYGRETGYLAVMEAADSEPDSIIVARGQSATAVIVAQLNWDT